MNKVNWIDGRYTTPNDFNAMQTEPEAHIEALGRRLPADVDGCVPAGAAAGVTIGAGVAWDSAGRRIVIPVGGAAVDMTGIDRPAANQYRWLTWFAVYQRINRGTMRDKTGVDQPAYFDDDYSVGVRAGAAFGDSSITYARAHQVATRPAAPAGAVGLGYSILDHQSAYQTLFTADTLFRSEAPRPITPFFVTASGKKVAEVLDSMASLVPRQRDYAFGSGYVWLNSNRHANPVLTVRRSRGNNVQAWYVPQIASPQPLHAAADTTCRLVAVFDRVASYGPEEYPLPATGGW